MLMLGFVFHAAALALVTGEISYGRQGDGLSVDVEHNICPLVTYNKPLTMVKTLGVVHV